MGRLNPSSRRFAASLIFAYFLTTLIATGYCAYFSITFKDKLNVFEQGMVWFNMGSAIGFPAMILASILSTILLRWTNTLLIALPTYIIGFALSAIRFNFLLEKLPIKFIYMTVPIGLVHAVAALAILIWLESWSKRPSYQKTARKCAQFKQKLLELRDNL